MAFYLFISIVTFATIGYGDISPVTLSSKLFMRTALTQNYSNEKK